MADGHALVLGGRGVAGIAWMIGLLSGLADAGDDVTTADLIIGTSAGQAGRPGLLQYRPGPVR